MPLYLAVLAQLVRNSLTVTLTQESMIGLRLGAVPDLNLACWISPETPGKYYTLFSWGDLVETIGVI
jgi:hypothetical protein